MMLLNGSLVFSMENEKVEETDKSIVHLNTQFSQAKDYAN